MQRSMNCEAAPNYSTGSIEESSCEYCTSIQFVSQRLVARDASNGGCGLLISDVACHEVARKIVNPVHLAVHELQEVLHMSLV